MNVAVIPARGGSKRIPHKNICRFGDKPMIAYPIAVARESGLFEHIVVSTDDEEIIEVARAHGAEVPFVRPAKLSDDFTGTSAVIAHAIRWMRDEREWPLTAVCCIYATTPFLHGGDLARGAEAIATGEWDYAFAVTDYAAPIFRAFSAHPDGGVEMFFPDKFTARSQDLPEALHDAGQFYWGLPEAWLADRTVFSRRSCPVRIPRWRVQDIDTEDDWRRAELMAAALGEATT